MRAHTPKTNISAPQSQKGSRPFFSKEGEGAFFPPDQVQLKAGKEHQYPSPFFGNHSGSAPFFTPSNIQPKLTIGQPGDKYEQEADAVADQVVQTLRSPGAAPAIQAKCAACAQEEQMVNKKNLRRQPEEEEKLQPKAIFESNEEQPLQRKCAACQEESIHPKRIQMQGGPSAASPDLESRLSATRGGGSPLPKDTRGSMESAFGADFSGVRVHTGSESMQMNQELGAQAFTHGSDIYFNQGKYDTGSSGGQKLLAHELTHVVQQGSSGELRRKEIIQCDLAQSLPTSRGVFEVDMVTREGLLQSPPPAGAKSGLRGTIKFDPATTAPYSNEIGLIQIVKLTNSDTGADVDPGSMTPGRGPSLRTTEDATTGVEGGFWTDVRHREPNTGNTDVPPGSNFPAQYPFGPAGSPGGRQIMGFKRSNDPDDIKKAEIFDFPGTRGATSNLDFEFETVAKGEDTMTVYGTLYWGFGIRAGDVVDEYVNVGDATSPTFDEALDLHRDFYVHEPVIFYFGFDKDEVTAAEAAKIDTFLDYLQRFPDVQLSLTGYADRRGNPDYNLDLSLRRAENVKEALIDKGIDESRIDDVILGFGSTEEFTSGGLAPNPGRSQDLEANRRGNRRVVLTFEHTMSFPGP